MRCSNCENSRLTLISEIDSETALVPNSDGQFMKGISAQRLLCEDCGCISIEYKPADRLARYFREEYDVSDSVQNNLIVVKDKVQGKHLHIATNLYKDFQNNFMPESAQVLEIACGLGGLTKDIASNYPKWQVTGVDPNLQADLDGSQYTNLKFVNDYFKPNYFKAASFDIVIAHGFLNRIPTLSTLKEICRVLKPGGFLSVEVVNLENSFYAPFIWDHSYTYLQEVFKKYLAYLGFEIKAFHDSVSTDHFFCQYFPEKAKSGEMPIGLELCDRTKSVFLSHQNFAKSVQKKWEASAEASPSEKAYLFGAGLYTSVLLSMIDKSKVSGIIDEVKYGKEVLGIPVLSLDQFSKISGAKRVFLYCREQYRETITKKLSNAGHIVTSLMD